MLVTPNDTSLPSPGHLLVAVLQLCFVSSSPGCPTHQRQKGQSRAPDTYGTILAYFLNSFQQKVMQRQGAVTVSISSPTSNRSVIPNLKSFQEETRETSNNPHFYQVWSGLIWNTCKIHLKTGSVTDPIVGGLRPLEKHPQMEYLVSQAQTTLKMVGIALGRSSEGSELATAK